MSYHVNYTPDSKIEAWTKSNSDTRYHNLSGPAYLRWSWSPTTTTGKLLEERYYIDGVLSNRNGPAIQIWSPQTGNLLIQQYYINGQLHSFKPDHPAAFEWGEDKNPIYRAYYNYGKLHNLLGPALIRAHPDGAIERYGYINDVNTWITLPNKSEMPSYSLTKNGIKLVELYEEYSPMVEKTVFKYSDGLKIPSGIYRNTQGTVIRKIYRPFDVVNIFPVVIVIDDYDQEGRISQRRFEADGQLHSDNTPASYTFDSLGNITMEGWFKKGQRHRIGQPALTRYQNNTKSFEQYWVDGVITNDQGPAEISWYPDGRIKTQKWYIAGLPHRLTDPAEIHYDPYGAITLKRWYYQGLLDRQDGPAEIVYGNSGVILEERWYKAGQLHRQDGPAVVLHGDQVIEHWMENGKYSENIPAIVIKDHQGTPVVGQWVRDNEVYKTIDLRRNII